MSATSTSTGTHRAWALVARREIVVKARDKGFLIGTVLTLVLMTAWIGWTAYSSERTQTYAMVTTAGDAAMGEAVAQLAPHLEEKVTVTVATAPDEESARATVASGEADAWLHRDGTGWTLTTESSENDLLGIAQQAVRAATIDAQAQEPGTTAAELEAGSVVTAQFLIGDAERAGLAQGIGFIMALLFFLAALMYGMKIANSVVEEKQSRIVEIIATSIPVRHLLTGKVLGNTVMAILQIVLYVAVGLIGLSFTPYSSFLPAMGAPVAWFLVFFAAGFIALACLWAVAGSLASRVGVHQSTSAPLTYLLMGVYFGSFLLSGTPKVIAAFIPPISAVLMPMRIVERDVPL